MNKKLLFSLLLAGTAFTGHADEARLLRFPATNGSDIVFSYAGDLYKAPLNGGEAQKLTSHIGYEMFARFSPDGKSIAFTGQYDGNTEVYLIPTLSDAFRTFHLLFLLPKNGSYQHEHLLNGQYFSQPDP